MRGLAVTAGAIIAVGMLPACGLRHGNTPRPVAADPTVTRLLRSAAAADDPNQHDSFVDALVALGSPAVPQLSRALKTDPDENVRVVAVEALGKMRGQGVVDGLLDALQDKSEDVRLAAVQALGVIADRRAVQPLLDQFAKDDNPQVRYECLTSLGLIGDPAAVDVLVSGTSDSDSGVRMWAMDALCEMNDAHAPALAIALLQDPNEYVRAHTIQYCGDALNNQEGRATLVELAIDAEQFGTTVWARRHLMEFLAHDAPGSALRDQMRSAALRGLHGTHAARAALLLGDLGDRKATQPLISALRDPDPLVRHHAATLLAKVGDRRAVPALIAALHDPVGLVAATAYNSLQWFADDGDPRARAAVQSYHGNRFSERLPRS